MNAKKRDWRTINRQRDKIIGFRATPEEAAIIREDAERAGMTVGAYLRKLALDAPVPRQSRRPPVEKQELARLLGDTGKMGSNLNQIAKRMNQLNLQGDYPGLAAMIPTAYTSIQEMLTHLKSMRIDLRKALNY